MLIVFLEEDHQYSNRLCKGLPKIEVKKVKLSSKLIRFSFSRNSFITFFLLFRTKSDNQNYSKVLFIYWFLSKFSIAELRPDVNPNIIVNFLKFLCIGSRWETVNIQKYWALGFYHPTGIYLFKVNKRNTRTMCEICSKLKIKTSKRHQGQKVQLSEAYLGSHETSMIEW